MSFVSVGVANATRPDIVEPCLVFVDDGVWHSILPTAFLERLGIRPLSRETFHLTNGNSLTRHRGATLVTLGPRIGLTNVLFGEPGDAALLGTDALIALTMVVDRNTGDLMEPEMTL